MMELLILGLVVLVLLVVLFFLVRRLFFPRILCHTCKRRHDCPVDEYAIGCNHYEKEKS